MSKHIPTLRLRQAKFAVGLLVNYNIKKIKIKNP